MKHKQIKSVFFSVPLARFSLQITVVNATFVPAFADQTSTEYMQFINSILPELNRIFRNVFGFVEINITGVFEGSVIVQ